MLSNAKGRFRRVSFPARFSLHVTPPSHLRLCVPISAHDLLRAKMRCPRCTIPCVYLLAIVLMTRGAQSDSQADAFYPFAKCSSWENPYSQYSGYVKSFNAELLMDAKIDSEFGDHYNYVAEGTGRTVRWTEGRSKLSFSFRFGLISTQTINTDQSWKAHIHASRCDVSSGGTHYLQNQNGLDGGENIFEVVFDAKRSGDEIMGTGNVTREFLADYDRAASVVVHIADGTRILCCNLAPALPKLPDTWSATIEANINNFDAGSNLSYTILRKEWYHAETNNLRIDEHSAYSRQTRMMNTVEERLITMHRNDTFPDGSCSDHPLQSRMSRFLTRGGTDHTIKSTAEMFSFEGDAPDEYHGITASHEYVRGVACEKWTRNVTRGTKKYVYEFYFPVSSWMIRYESYHRMLWRVVVKSDEGFRGQPVLHFYDFIDMVPFIEDMEVFNPCNVYNTGKPLAGNCSCGRIGAPAPPPASWGGGGSGEEGMNAGEVAGLSIFFLIFGSSVSFIGTYVYFTQFVNRVPLFPETEMSHA
jgi:hypothetical protein